MKPTTLAHYDNALRAYVLPHFGKAKISTINREDVQIFLDTALTLAIKSPKPWMSPIQKTMVVADEVSSVLKLWKQTTQFAGPEDWVFASPVKLGRQPIGYTHVWYRLDRAALQAGIGHISSPTLRHTYRTWLDSVGTPVGVQQKLIRHADIRTTMSIYGDDGGYAAGESKGSSDGSGTCLTNPFTDLRLWKCFRLWRGRWESNPD